VKGYVVPAHRLAELTGQLEQKFAVDPQTRVVADEATNQVIVVGSADVQRETILWLNAALGPAADATAPAERAGETAASEPAPQVERIARATHALKHLSARDVESALARIWGAAAVFATSADHKSTTVRLAGGKPNDASVHIDYERDLVTIDSPQGSLNSWRRIVQSIDVPRRGDWLVDAVSLNKTEPDRIHRMIELLRTEAGATVVRPGPRRHIGQFVSMFFQAEGAQLGGAQPPPPPPPGGQPPPAGDQELGAVPGGESMAETLGRIGNVRIEFIQDLGIVIIQGNRRDVDRVKRLIQEIEEISKQTQPEVEVYYLQHVNGEAMAALINQIFPQVFAARQGTVTVTALVKPNAVLLVGRKEAIEMVIDLVKRLDQPVAPETQIRVFRLKFLPVIDAERTVRSLFTTRPGFEPTPRTGLGTRVLVIADFRSNSLIVQASPRDLDEVAALLERIDIDDAPAATEVKVFKLRNSLAEELAPVLQEAITGQIQGQQVQQQQIQQQGAGGTGGTPTPAASARRSTSIQLLQIDQNGQRIIKSGILSDFRVSADPRGNSLIVAGPASGMPLMEELIRQLDGLPGVGAQVKVFTIVNGDATQLATMLQTLFGLQTGGQGAQFPFGATSVTGSGESSLVPLRFAVDTRTNSIIASGSAGDLAVVYGILVRLDEGGIRQRELRVFRLKNTSATAVADSLNRYLQGQQQLLQAQQQGQLVTAVQALEEQVIVVDEPVTNSLIVNATARYMPEIIRIIEDLDKRNPMVVIQLLIAEVTLSDLDEFGAEFGLQDSILFQRGILNPATGVSTQGFNFNNNPLGNITTGDTEHTAGQGITHFGVGRTSSQSGLGGLVLSASSESVSILIRALQQSQRLQVLSRPQIQTMDNQPAFVQVGARVPRIQGQTLTATGAAQNDVVDVNVGIILGVTPRVTPDGMVVMEIDAEKSEVGSSEPPDAIPVSVTPTGDTIFSPQILTTTAQTTITARSGQTVILGGLITRSQSESTSRVPYLGDIPVLGRLFRFDTFSLERKELLFILTPYIMDTADTEALLNLRETERMSWCLADVVNVHGALPAGAAGANLYSPQSPLIFPDETPAGSMPAYPPGQPETVPPGAPLPAQPPGGPSSVLPPSSRRPVPPAADIPAEARMMRLPEFLRRPAGQPAFEAVPATAEEPAWNPAGSQPRAPVLTPATVSPPGYQTSLPAFAPAAQADSTPEQEPSIYRNP
jgi:type II secretion system protein D